MSVRRFSSRREQLGRAFLAERLTGAVRYKRIAGYFRSSILELVGEELASVPEVRVVCNSEIHLRDLQVATMAREAMHERLLSVWRDVNPAQALMAGPERYRRLFELLTSGRLQVRVVPRETVFVHGKAGVITYPDGRSTSFIGSANESLSAFARNHELVWEDPSPEAVAWVEEEFDHLWNEGIDLPDVVIHDVQRLADRVEVVAADLEARDVAPAFMTESPLHDAGSILQPWQRAFVNTFVRHRDAYEKARLLVADEVGLGKTLSMATSAIVANLLGDGPVLILCPATLTLQWQTELLDKLGVPSVVWHSNRKGWLTPEGTFVPSTAEAITRAPMQVAIVSTGLIARSDGAERAALLRGRYGTLVLDEAHKARARVGVSGKRDMNNLMSFMLDAAPRARHVILGTATPMQLHPNEVWDLMAILAAGAPHVLGNDFSLWQRGDERTELIQRDRATPADPAITWDYLRNPLPHASDWPENDAVPVNLYDSIRRDLDLPKRASMSDASIDALTLSEPDFRDAARSDRSFFRRHNPVIRHTILRRRADLEDQGLLPRIGVTIHPNPNAPTGTYTDMRATFTQDHALHTTNAYKSAYASVEAFLDTYIHRRPSARLIRPLLLQRVCSSLHAGINTLTKILDHTALDDEGLVDDFTSGIDDMLQLKTHTTNTERSTLEQALDSLRAAQRDGDPKHHAVHDALHHLQSGNHTWLEHGCIVFSQYYDTAYWIAEQLAAHDPEQRIGLYAGAGKSRIFHAGRHAEAARETIKRAVRDRTINLVIATDAAAEGLNLQTLGTLINIDLPWNPAKLEQRVGRIRRIGQARKNVDVLNLVYTDTQDERIYQTLSKRMEGTYDIFGKLPDVLEDDWIDDIEDMLQKMETYLHLQDSREDVFGNRYRSTLSDTDRERWLTWSRVIARANLQETLRAPWRS